MEIKDKIKIFIRHTWFVIIPLTIMAITFGFLVGVGVGYEEPTCPKQKVCPAPVVCPKIETVLPQNNCTNRTTVRIVERCSNSYLYNQSNSTGCLDYIITIKRLERERDAIFDLNDSTSNQLLRLNLTRCRNSLDECEIKINKTKEALE